MKLLRAIKGLYEVWEDVDPGADLDSHLDGLLNHSLFPASAFYKEYPRTLQNTHRTLSRLSFAQSREGQNFVRFLKTRPPSSVPHLPGIQHVGVSDPLLRLVSP